MKEAFETVKGVLSPEDNWSKFAMKITGLVAVAGIALFGFNLYKTAGCVVAEEEEYDVGICLLYTSPSPRDATLSRMPSSA